MIRIITFLLLVVSATSLLNAERALAQTPQPTNYNLLAPIPLEESGCTGAANTECKTNASAYLVGVFKLTIALAGVLAVLMIIIGGIKYMSSEAFTEKGNAKGTITNAIWGLLLAIGAWLILYSISPNDKNPFVNFDLSTLERQTIPNNPPATGASTIGVPMTAEQIAADTAVRQSLPFGISAYRGPCIEGQTRNCVNLNGLQPSVINGLVAVRNTPCNCSIVITAGTEGGHTTGSSHYSGIAVDVRSDIRLNSTVANSAPLSACQTYSAGGGRWLWEPLGSKCGGEVASTNDHWHASF